MKKTIEDYGNFDIYKQSIYIDIDDVILESSVAIISLINQKYLLNPPKSIQHLKDYSLKSIKKDLTKEEINALYESEDFWKIVQFNPVFVQWLSDKIFFKQYNWIFFTKGSAKNLKDKHKKLQQLFEQYQLSEYLSYIGIPMEEKKTNLRMMEAIQIDDNLENLAKSDAKTKILVKNNVDTKYNNYLEQEHFIPGLYIADDMDQVDQILKFNLINVL